MVCEVRPESWEGLGHAEVCSSVPGRGAAEAVGQSSPGTEKLMVAGRSGWREGEL